MSIFTRGCCLFISVTVTWPDCFIWPHKVRLVSPQKSPFFCWVLFTLPPSVIYSFTLYPLLILPFLSYLLTFSACNPVIKFIASQWEPGWWKHRYSCHVESFQKRGSHPRSQQTHACSMRREAIRRSEPNTDTFCRVSADGRRNITHTLKSLLTSRAAATGSPSIFSKAKQEAWSISTSFTFPTVGKRNRKPSTTANP